jgi:hypothetical protein
MFTTSEATAVAPSSGLDEIAAQHYPAAPDQSALFPGQSGYHQHQHANHGHQREGV